MKKYDVTAMGELLIDFTESGMSEQGNPVFEANPGGAPCNVLAMLTRLGHRTAFIGKTGKDFLGDRLAHVLSETGIETAGLMRDEKVHTTLAFVRTQKDGDRDFFFYREPGADMMLTEEEIPEELVRDSSVFHFGTLSMTHEGIRRATMKALRTAKESGTLISLDPNLRPALWDSEEEARKQTEEALRWCDVLKISDNEIQWLTGTVEYDRGVEWIRSRFPGIRLILVTMGKDGSRAYGKDFTAEAPAYLREDTVETTGAGDTFFGCVLHYICEYGVQMGKETAEEMLDFANAAASVITTRKGALRVMPGENEIRSICKKAGRKTLHQL